MVERVDYLGPYLLDLNEPLFNGVAHSLNTIYRWGIPKPQPMGIVACSTFDTMYTKANEKWGNATPKNLMAIRMANIAENYNGYNPSAMLHTGWVAGLTSSGMERIIFHLTPVVVTFEIRFSTNQMATMDAYIRNWLHRFRYESGFDIDLENPSFTFHINVVGNDSFDYPTNERSDDPTLTVDTQCRAYSYIGHYEAVPTIRRINYGVALDPNNTGFVQKNLPNQFDVLLDSELETLANNGVNSTVADYMSAWTLTLTGNNSELDTSEELLAAQEAYIAISNEEISSIALSGIGTVTSLTPGR